MIKSLREFRSWSQADLAKELGVDQATVSRMERGAPIARPVEILLDRLIADSASSSSEVAGDRPAQAGAAA
ncbi:MAG: helix-turn-helix transcriptional regulator [Devosia sp.]|nr:helix-turn-helix transcriptional regulator [Devosia sp.]